ncbi:hypothetical protein C2W62_12625 [Candidatus Entotheonella serta]|nr:hypothetical protein C2W62_12625 [Candidatus Entotheonella serta]
MPYSGIRRLVSLSAGRQVALAVMCVMVVGTFTAYAQAPPAGSTIGNQATFTFDDGTGTPRVVNSNLVQTVVQQVASLTLTAPGTTTAAPGNQVAFPHTLTNRNGTDNFTLTLVNDAGDNFDFTGFAIYRDVDQNGVPDDFADLNGTNVPLNSGEQFHFVVVGTVPGTTPAGQTGTMSVTATSVFDVAQTDTNVDTTNVTGNAVINVTKAIDVSNGPAGSGPYTYTLTYTNAGNATALNVTLTDVIPTNMTYVPNSGRWSVTIATVLTDADAGDSHGTAPDTILYDFNVTTANTVTAVINQVEAGESGTLTFQVTVDGGAPAGIINNTAVLSYDDGSGTIIGPQNTNTVPFTVDPTRSVDLTDNGSATDSDATVNDIITVATAPQGSTVEFENVIINTGNAPDTYNITFGDSTFPGITAFQLFQADGSTPLVDTNSDSIPDTGPVAAGATVRVILKAILDAAASGPGPYEITKTATSISNPAISDTTTDRLDAIQGSAVDVTNDISIAGGAAPTDGLGTGPEATPVRTNNASTPTTFTSTFTLFINNTGPIADAYDLAASTDNTFATITLPTGWGVQFFLDDGDGVRDSGDALIANTGNIPAGSDTLVFADVSIPANFAPGLVDLFFRALSPTSGASDIIHDAMRILPVRSITLSPVNVGQVFPGGTVVYQHTLDNDGNVDEGAVSSAVTLTVVNSQSGFNTVVYYDINDNGVIDVGTDPVVSTNGTPTVFPVTIPAGANLTLLARVAAPPAAIASTVDAATITATVAGNISGLAPPPAVAVTDTTTVISGDVSLHKTQALDADCNGVADTAFGMVNLLATLGQCVCYEVIATNTSTTNTVNSVFNDMTPIYTTLSVAPAVTLGSITQQPALDTNGPIVANVGTLAPLQASVLSFCVQIDQ